MKCKHCSGLVVPEEFFLHGVWYSTDKCLICSRYYTVEVKTKMGDVTPDMMRQGEYKPWRKVSDDTIEAAKKLLDDGLCPSFAARKVGINHVTLRKIIERNGWQVSSA